MRKLAKMVVLAVLLAPALASAQVSFGARLGYAFAMGEAYQDLDLADGIKAQIPIQLDLGYRVTPAFTLGGYFSYGLGLEGDDLGCDDCSLRLYRLGLQLEYAFPRPAATPWIGAGIGYEWASIDDNDLDATLGFKGFEFLNLQGGVEWKVNKSFSIGPFAMLNIGRYSRMTAEEDGVEAEADIEDKAFHEWLQIGVRGRFDL